MIVNCSIANYVKYGTYDWFQPDHNIVDPFRDFPGFKCKREMVIYAENDDNESSTILAKREIPMDATGYFNLHFHSITYTYCADTSHLFCQTLRHNI